MCHRICCRCAAADRNLPPARHARHSFPHTLHGGARRRFEQLLAQRADLRLVVHDWEQRLGGLGQAVGLQTPSPQVWQRIAQRTVMLQNAPQKRTDVTASCGWLGWLGWLRPAAWGLGGIATGLIAA